MNTLKRKEVLIGLLVIVALVILFFGINFLKGVNLFKATNYYYASYTNVAGLANSAPVTLNGFKVGLVREIKYQYDNPGHVVVEMSLDKELRLPAGTRAEISSDILGTASIVLHMGDASTGFYAVGDTIEGAVQAGMLDAVSNDIMPAVNSILPRVDTLLIGLNTLVNDPALHTSVQRMDQITAELNGTIAEIHAIMRELRPVADRMNAISANVDTISGNLANVSGTLADAPVDSLLNDLAATAAHLEELTAALNNPDSSLGKLSNDPELYDNINATVVSLDSLFIDIRRNPKRYINIKLL